MKKLFFIALFIASLTACNQQKTETSTLQDTTSQMANLSAAPIYDLLVQTILGSETGVIRGINFGDDMNKVKKTEKLEPIEGEDNTEHLAYSLEMPSLETVDIFYKKDAQKKVSAIEIDVYLNKKEDIAPLIKTFESYFSKRYGKNSTVAVSITDQSKEKLPLLHIKLIKALIL